MLIDDYAVIDREMLSLSLEEIGFERLFSMLNLESTAVIETKEEMGQRFWL